MRAAAATVVVLITGSGAFAHDTLVSVQPFDTAASDTGKMIVRIGRLEVTGRAVADTIPVTIQAPTRPLAGFDLKIGMDSPYLTITNILPGDLMDTCRWEYFNAREVPTVGKENYPTTLWHAVALARGINFSDTTRPTCYGSDSTISLCKLVVSNGHVLQMPETTVAIFFLWESCADNLFSSPSGRKVAIAATVLDYLPAPPSDTTQRFPTRFGTPRDCVSARAINLPERVVEFHNGGVTYRLAPADPKPSKSQGRSGSKKG